MRNAIAGTYPATNKKFMTKEEQEEYKGINIDIKQWSKFFDVDKETYQDLPLFSKIKDKNNKIAVNSDDNKEAKKNQTICISVLQENVQKADLLDGCKILMELKTAQAALFRAQKNDMHRFFGTLVSVTQSILIDKLAQSKGININNIPTAVHNELVAELEILPYKQQLEEDNALLDKYMADIKQLSDELQKYLAKTLEFPTLNLLTTAEQDHMNKLTESLAIKIPLGTGTELDLLEFNKKLKENLLKDPRKNKAYHDYKSQTSRESEDIAYVKKYNDLLQAKLDILTNMKKAQEQKINKKHP